MEQEQARAEDGWSASRRRTTRPALIGFLLIFLIPLLLLALGWSMRRLPNLPVPQTRPGRVPDAHWENRAKLDTPRDDFGIATVDGRIWVMGGMTGERGNRLASVEIYDPAANRWTAGPALPTGRSSFRAAAIGQTIYIFGGATTDKPITDEVDALDTAAGQWRTLAPMPTPRFGHAVVELGGRIYIIGGYSGGQGIGATHVFEPATGNWRAVASLPTPRYNLAAVALNGKIYAFGGWVDDAPSGVTEIYDPATDSWAKGPAMTAPMSNFGATVLDGRIHAVMHKAQQVFDPRANLWLIGEPMPTTRHGEGVATVGDTVYAIGGCYEEPQYDLDQVEAYVPGPGDETAGPAPAGGYDIGGARSVVGGALLTIALITAGLLLGRRPAHNRDEPQPERATEAVESESVRE